MKFLSSLNQMFLQSMKTRFGQAIVISIILHILFLFLKIEQQRKISDSVRNARKTDLVVMDRDKLSNYLPENLRKNFKKMQIVQNENQGKNERPKDSRFLGEKDQTFEKSTIAKRVGIFEESGKGVADGQKKVGGENKPEKSMEAKKLSFDDLKMGSLPSEAIEKFKKGGKTLEKEKGGRALGSVNGQNKDPGLSATNDYINDVPIGEVTNLNTIEFKYYGFYNRIRKRLEQYWGNSLRQKAEAFFKQGRSFSSEVKITSLLVTIDSKGNITKVVLKSTSGINELDEAAIESFNKAGPFPNPPTGMLINGEATIEWGFVVRG